ncbi:MAG: membrane dipeptidase [Firmicutes bacterium]|nr:membrane dipeptidase [Bacillota bacterium]
MIVDLHNDVLIKKNSFFDKKNVVICAVWASELINPIVFLDKIKHKVKYKAIEDLWFINRENINIIKEFNPIYASLTWNNENNLAGGTYSDANLTKLGKDVIKYLVSNEISLDTAHLNEKSFYDAIEYLADLKKISLICSHTCFNGVFKHKRNLTDNQIRVIINANGIIGLTLVSDFMGKQNANEYDVLRQIEYFLGKFSYKFLSLGTDFFGADNLAINSYKKLEKFKNHLIKMGLSEKILNAIFYENALNYINDKGEKNE